MLQSSPKQNHSPTHGACANNAVAADLLEFIPTSCRYTNVPIFYLPPSPHPLLSPPPLPSSSSSSSFHRVEYRNSNSLQLYSRSELFKCRNVSRISWPRFSWLTSVSVHKYRNIILKLWSPPYKSLPASNKHNLPSRYTLYDLFSWKSLVKYSKDLYNKQPLCVHKWQLIVMLQYNLCANLSLEVQGACVSSMKKNWSSIHLHISAHK